MQGDNTPKQKRTLHCCKIYIKSFNPSVCIQDADSTPLQIREALVGFIQFIFTIPPIRCLIKHV